MQRDISNSAGFVLIANNYMAASNESLEDFIPPCIPERAHIGRGREREACETEIPGSNQ